MKRQLDELPEVHSTPLSFQAPLVVENVLKQMIASDINTDAA